jgi:hypothetical protein
LFIWASFHLFFLSNNFALQLLDYKRIWKFATIAGIFALGFGISLANSECENKELIGGNKTIFKVNHYWVIYSYSNLFRQVFGDAIGLAS